MSCASVSVVSCHLACWEVKVSIQWFDVTVWPRPDILLHCAGTAEHKMTSGSGTGTSGTNTGTGNTY